MNVKRPWAILTAFVLASLAWDGQGAVLDWSDVNWTPSGSLNESFNNVDGSGVNMNFAFSGSTGAFNNNYDTPEISNLFTGGFGSGTESLAMVVDFGNRNQTVTLTISFSILVKDVSFSIFDIDYASGDYQDRVVVRGHNGANTFIPTITGSSANSVTQSTGTILGTSTAGNGSSAGTATINFGSSYVSSITIVYGNGSLAPFNPGDQGIGLYDITFTPVPEASAWWAGASLAGLAVGSAVWRWRRRWGLGADVG